MSNKSGIIPLGYKVLIKVIKLDQKTKGGIIIPTEALEREEAASQIATIVDYGPAAFTIGAGDLEKEWKIEPSAGAGIVINKYAGIIVKGIDEEEYRIINDKEIIALLNKTE